MTANEWNEKYPIGTKVRYFPIKDELDMFTDSETRNEAWELGMGNR